RRSYSLANAALSSRRRRTAGAICWTDTVHQPFPEPTSLDDLVGLQSNGRRQRQAQGFGRLHIDRELELGGLLDRKFAGLRAFKDLGDDEGMLPPHGSQAWPVGYQASAIDERFQRVHGWKVVARRQLDNGLLQRGDEGRRKDIQGLRAS